jgi:hypothetical protein
LVQLVDGWTQPRFQEVVEVSPSRVRSEGLDRFSSERTNQSYDSPSMLALEARIDGLTFKRKDTKNTFVDTAKRFIPNKALQRFNPKSEFAKC